MMSPTPPPPRSGVSNMHDPDGQSMMVHYDMLSEMPKSAVSRDASSLQSERLKKMWQEGDTESPAPPPPSPEPTTEPSHLGGPSRDQSLLNPVQEVLLESDSDMTISAKPPSNLDDISIIQTPTSLAPSRGLQSRETTQYTMEPVMESPLDDALGFSPTIPEGQQDQELVDNHGKSPPHAPSEVKGEQLPQAKQGTPNSVQTSPASAMVPANQEKIPEEVLLDQFDSTKEQFEEELKREYKKLSEDGNDSNK